VDSFVFVVSGFLHCWLLLDLGRGNCDFGRGLDVQYCWVLRSFYLELAVFVGLRFESVDLKNTKDLSPLRQQVYNLLNSGSIIVLE
jgi:hypothetical protein